MQKIVEITLFRNSTADSKPKKVAAQTIEITHEPETESRGVDGKVSIGHHPSTIRWFGGTARDLQDITNVRIVDSRGAVLIDGQLNAFFRVPREVDGSVIFDVLKPE
jgi:hypothetical protein